MTAEGPDIHEGGAAHARSGRVVRDVVIAVLMAVCAIVLGASTLVPVHVTVQGQPTSVGVGATLGDLVRDGALPVAAGDLLSVRGAILRRGGGRSPAYFVNGRAATSATPLTDGALVTAAPGRDAVEGTESAMVSIAQRVVYRGSGPAESVEESGSPAYVRVVRGAVSGEEVTRTLVSSGRAMVVRREPAYAGDKRVALTFDDGPWPGSTDAVLGELRSAGVKATFFLIGRQAVERAEIVRREVAAGMEIGNHSWSHRYLSSAPLAEVRSEISRGDAAITSLTGTPTVWYRPAGGLVSALVFDEAARLGNRIILWSVDPQDWRRPPAATIAQRVLDHVRPGSVILMHDGGGDRSNTVVALRTVLAALKARGYQMVTLSELYGAKP